MSLSTIDKELFGYFIQLNELQKKSLVEMIRAFLKDRKDEVRSVSFELYNKEIDEAMERIERGEFTTLTELEKEMQSW